MQVTTKLCELWHPLYSYFMVHLDLVGVCGGGGCMEHCCLPALAAKTCWRVKLHGDTSTWFSQQKPTKEWRVFGLVGRGVGSSGLPPNSQIHIIPQAITVTH